MRKKPLIVWSLLTIVILIYIGILLLSIKSNDDKLKKEVYRDWHDSYVMKNEYGSFVNTSNDPKKPIALSESQGYGMLITALAGDLGYAKESDFKALVSYYEAFKIADDNYLMEWKQTTKEKKWQSEDHNSATDGDLDIAYALFRASKVWPDSKEDYSGKAKNILESLKEHVYSEKTGVLSVGNWATESKLYWNLFRPSDVTPYYFDSFYRKTKDPIWLDINQKSLDYLEILSDNNEHGLIPDFAWIDSEKVVPAKAKDVATKNDGDYAYNALRIPLRLAYSDNPRATKIKNKLLTFFSEQQQVKAGYTLKGEPLEDYPSISYSAPLLLAAVGQDEFSGIYADSRWVMYEPIDGSNYYGDSLKAMSVLVVE